VQARNANQDSQQGGAASDASLQRAIDPQVAWALRRFGLVIIDIAQGKLRREQAARDATTASDHVRADTPVLVASAR